MKLFLGLAIASILQGSLLVSATAASAQESNQPYIDQLKKDLPPSRGTEGSDGPDPYIQAQKKKLKKQPQPESSEGYIETLRKSDPRKAQAEGSYSDEQKAKLGTKEDGGAIQALQEGRSELKPNIQGDINHAFSFRVGTVSVRDVFGVDGAENAPFADVYGTGWTPDLLFTWEWQPWHSEWYGNIAVFFGGGLTYNRGFGAFEVELTNPFGGSFPAASQTRFTFISVPLMVGLNYRFNLARYVRPYVQIAPTATAYMETRSDTGARPDGFSRGVFYGGGVNFLLNPLFKAATWSLYEGYQVKKYYLTLDYSRTSPLGGAIRFQVSQFSLGFTYEY